MKELLYSKAEVKLHCKGQLLENPIWNFKTKTLTFVDIKSKCFYIWKKKLKKYKFSKIISNFLPTSSKNVWLASSKNKILRIKKIGKKIYINCECTLDIDKNSRLNDAKIDSSGRLWASSMDNNQKDKTGKLYFFKNLTKPNIISENFIIGNGIDWSPNQKKLYFVKSDKKTIFIYDYNKKSGKVKNCKLFAKIPKSRGIPDGICVDTLGYIWVACWDGGCIIRYNQKGKINNIIELPVSRPTSLCFGGGNLKNIYVTTARKLNNNKLEKNSGNVFIIKTNIKGKKIHYFKF